MSNKDHQTNASSTRRRKNIIGNIDKSGWQCRVCRHVNLAETQYCSKCGFRLGVHMYFK